jgi:lipopolysaccharide/colanic/teichoic acid biosynthesis glycosyltransferase
MHPNPHTTDLKLATARDLLFVGFGQSFDANINNFPYQSNKYQYSLENNSFLAFLWLGKRVDEIASFQLPYAILCNYEWLQNDQFRLARQLAAHPDLCTVPLIAFCQKENPANKNALSANGIDDCYTIPVDWSMLESRLEFLNQFKPKVLKTSAEVTPENFVFRIPLRKRIFDLIGASLGIVLTSWIWLPVMLAIRLESRGPVIYKSKRVGSGYQVFEFLKFRSMCEDAEEQLLEIQHLNRYQNGASNGNSVFVKISSDPRTTRVGRFIRKYSIDELPQLLNVLRGDMSLVGNRPLPQYEASLLTVDEWSTRFMAPAGITGLWQVTKRGHSHMSVEDRINLDIVYAQSHTDVWADLRIMRRTFGAFIQHENV